MPAPAFVSVITPVYNGAAYLAECIESVRRQTWSEWEYLVLDNRSTDESARVAERAAGGDPRIRIVRATEFVGLYANHNRALRAIDGRSRYVKIVHADDWLYPECLERMVAVAEANPAVGVVSSFRLQGDLVEHDGLVPHGQQSMSGREVVRRALLGPPWVTGSPSSLLYRTDLVRRSREFFDEPVWHADTDAVFRILLESDLGFVHQVLTFTRIHPGAMTPFSHLVNTYIPQELRATLRYGREVLAPADYRRMLRKWLFAYLWYLARQAAKPARWRDARFHEFHRREIELLLEDAARERSAIPVLRLCRGFVRTAHAAAPQPDATAAA